jgi:hypothetical protein
MPLDRPTQTEILEAVEALLEEKVKPLVSGEVAYEVRIALSLLRLAQRERASGAPLEDLEREGRASLMPDAPTASFTELCARIRAGVIADDDPRLIDHLRDVTLAKVAIDQPKYAAYRDVLANGWPGR